MNDRFTICVTHALKSIEHILSILEDSQTAAGWHPACSENYLRAVALLFEAVAGEMRHHTLSCRTPPVDYDLGIEPRPDAPSTEIIASAQAFVETTSKLIPQTLKSRHHFPSACIEARAATFYEMFLPEPEPDEL